MPVLIVLHHARSGRVFARWFQSYDPHSEPWTERSIAIAFRDDDELTPAAMGRLLRDMEIHRRLSTPALALPLELIVDRRDESVAGLPSASVTLSLRDAARRFPDAFRIVESEGPATMGSIILTRGSASISLRGLITSTVHYPDPLPGEPDLKLVSNDLLVMLAVVINRLGLYDVAARLFAEHSIGSSVIQNEQTIGTVARSMTRTHRIGDAIRILEGLRGTDAFERMLLTISLTWTGMSDVLTESEREAVLEYLVREAERYESSADTRHAAIGYYNLANRLRAFGRHQQALDYYARAGELDPTYEERPYFSGDMAGSLFEAGRYQEAVLRYQTAVNLGARERYLPLLADAQLFAGQYAEASRTFSRVLEETTASRNPGEWSLKSLIADRIVGLAGSSQTRDEATANSLADLASDVSDEEARRRLSEALRADALFPLAWFNLAILELRQGNVEDAYLAFIAAAVLSRFDLFAFAMAVVLGLDMLDPHVGDVVRTAYAFNGSQFLRFLTQDLNGLSPEEHAELLGAVDQVLASGGSEFAERSVEYRFINDDGSYESLGIDLE